MRAKCIRYTWHGQKGCFVYCEDKALLEYMSRMTSIPVIRR